jgi:microcin C transport system permease protein
MMWNYIRFDFGESYFRSIDVIDLIIEKMPVSISLGRVDDCCFLHHLDSAGDQEGGHGRFALRCLDIRPDHRRLRGARLPVRHPADRLFAGGSFFDWFPLRGLTSDNWAELSLFGKIVDYFWHLALPLIALSLAAFATTTLLTKNSFIDEIRKQYVTTARAKGLSERQVLYRHVFRNAMLIIIAGFPGAFISAFFSGSLLIETIFSLDGLGRLGFESVIKRDYPVVFATLFIFSLMGLVVGLISDLVYTWVDPRIDFEKRDVG